jgi:FdhD protein
MSPLGPKPPAPSTTYPIRRIAPDGAEQAGEWGIATETAIEINVNGRPLAVMMATPADIEDLARGFALTEGVLSDIADVQGVAVRALPEGLIADVAADPAKVLEARVRARFLEGRSGCGLCGVETLADAIRAVRPVDQGSGAARPPVALEAVRTALSGLGREQPLNQATRTVHAAAWCSLEGAILAVREDVGRHNALDKLIGARAQDMAGPGFVVMTSRCSFELVQKAAVVGVGTLATVSAPTSRALELARAAAVRLIGVQGRELIEFDAG